MFLTPVSDSLIIRMICSALNRFPFVSRSSLSSLFIYQEGLSLKMAQFLGEKSVILILIIGFLGKISRNSITDEIFAFFKGLKCLRFCHGALAAFIEFI